MQNLLIIFLMICLMFGFANMVVSYILNIKYNNRISKYYLLLTVCLFMDNGISILVGYGLTSRGTWIGMFFDGTNHLLTILAYVGYTVVAVVLSNTLFKYKSIPKLYFLLLIPIYLIIVIYGIWVFDQVTLYEFIVQGIIYMMYGQVLTILLVDLFNLKYIKHESYYKILKGVMFLVCVGVLLMIIENMILIEVLYSGPIIYLFINGIGLYYSIQFVFKRQETFNETMNIKDLETIYDTYDLTPREREITNLVLEAYTNREIADELFISEGTVKNHIYKVYKKMDIKSRSEIINLLKA